MDAGLVLDPDFLCKHIFLPFINNFNAVNITPFQYFSIRLADYSGMISSIRRNIFSENDRFFLIK